MKQDHRFSNSLLYSYRLFCITVFIPPSMLRDELISRPVPQVGASVTEVERGREPGEVLRDSQRVLLIVHVEQFDGRFVIVVIVQVRARRARSLVIDVEFLVHAVGQRATLVYQLQLSTRFLQPDLLQRHICVSVEHTCTYVYLYYAWNSN